MITCPVCGYLNPVDVVVCQDCGSDLSHSPDLVGFEEEDDYDTDDNSNNEFTDYDDSDDITNEDDYYDDDYDDDTEYDEDIDDDYYDDGCYDDYED